MDADDIPTEDDAPLPVLRDADVYGERMTAGECAEMRRLARGDDTHAR